VGGQELADLGDVHGRQAPEDVAEVCLGVKTAAPATDDQGVDQGTAPAGVRVPDEEPPAATDCRIMPRGGLDLRFPSELKDLVIVVSGGMKAA
jgi:hypothetical protein